MSEETVTIELSKSEALVLFEFVSRFTDEEKLEILDQAEERVLWNICASLEKLLDEPLRADYSQLLANAREEVRDKESDSFK
jgi:hypothetical protein